MNSVRLNTSKLIREKFRSHLSTDLTEARSSTQVYVIIKPYIGMYSKSQIKNTPAHIYFD